MDTTDSAGVRGGTDGTIIGNSGDRMKVDAIFSTNTTQVQFWSNKLRYVDMNAGTGGVARGTSIPNSASWTTLYSYSGTGYIAGLIVNVETFATGWEFKLVVDGDEIYSLLDTNLAGDAIYDVDDVTDVNQSNLGISKGSHERFVFSSPLNKAIRYNTNVTVQLRRQAGAKKFQAGLIVLSKET